ncbi:uncharacterized protein LOC131042773 [Cryptomeria japonica]|uniref:uncharacterized protein LOC131042773 n=1 Tax=Cryptomeria japonica TaxID=3369 RepID=UPI0025AC0187|nr:uncharacterized protein LOC131042773 [Cryptomeria japonica]
MAKMTEAIKVEESPCIVKFAPFIVAALIVAHLIAFVYWIYRVAIEQPPRRRKTQ